MNQHDEYFTRSSRILKHNPFKINVKRELLLKTKFLFIPYIKSKTYFLSANPEEGVGAGDESSEVREDRGHVQSDLPQRRLCAAQLEIALRSYAHLRKSANSSTL